MKKGLIILTVAVLFFIYGDFCRAEEKAPLNPQNKISLDIKGMDIVDVLKMLASRAGMNIVVGKNVTGRVTLFLKDVDIQDAFEIILLSNDLAYDKKEEIINVMTQRDYELLYGSPYQDKKQAKTIQLKYAKAADLSRALNQMKSNIGKVVVDEGSNTIAMIDSPEKIKEMEEFIRKTDLPVQTRIFSLNYAQADKLSSKLQEVITKGVGSISIDERTNKIVVKDYPEKLQEIAKVISAFDEKTPQVLIDAQIIELTPSDKLEMGVNWDFWIEKYFKLAAKLPIGTDNRLLFGTPNTDPTRKGQYKAVIDMLRTIGDTKILSSPRIMALNNQEAKILVGTKDAYITSTTSQGGSSTTVTSQSVNFVDVGIKLYVTPTINRDNFVTMKIRPEISSSQRTEIISEGQITEIPIVTTSESETTVMVKDGVTIIIGGLKKDRRARTQRKIPWISDIPILGLFFQSNSDEFTGSELVILLTPHIISGENALTDFAEIKPEQGAVVKMIKGNLYKEKISDLERSSLVDTSSEYYDLVADKVRAFASVGQPKGEGGEVKVLFTLDNRGQLISEPRVIYSTNRNLDILAIQSIKHASPFPAFPRQLSKADEDFYITIDYK